MGTSVDPLASAYYLKDDGTFPNNEHLPVLFYPGVLLTLDCREPSQIEYLFGRNNWRNAWRNGIYEFHHYHSTAHEVLGIYGGLEIQLNHGDVIVLPAGVAHKNMGSGDNFKCVGAYPSGQEYDMNYGKQGERPKADDNIRKVPLPKLDPVFGEYGPLMDKWKV
jgi:uncharacterized protein YjlB